ncbi:MAG: ester cyclase [Candidatus Nanopelagicales bacterium]|nr:ester cyclase [Candidatus Nanopelagicales bacterium]
MTTHENVVEVFRAWDSGDGDTIRRLYAEDYVDHDPLPGTAGGLEGVVQQIQILTSAFSSGNTEIEDVVEGGDRVCVRWRFTGAHTGDFMGAPASGNQVEIQGIEILRYEDGRIVEGWTRVDLMTLMMQTGVIPSPG